MARTQIRNEEIKDETIIEKDIELNLLNNLKFSPTEVGDMTIPNKFCLVTTELKIVGELIIKGDLIIR